MSNVSYFDVAKVSRMIGLGMSQDVIIPYFTPLVKNIIRTSVVYDGHNHSEEDLVQIGLVKAQEVIDKFDPAQGNLFSYATTLIRHAIWTEARLRPIDRRRDTDEMDFDAQASIQHTPHVEAPELGDQFFKQLRLEGELYSDAAKYIYGVLLNNEYESNKARVLKTLTNGYDINSKHARFLMDHVLVALRRRFSKGVQEVRDDAMFRNRYKHSLVREIRDLLGERTFERLVHFFGGLTLYIPSIDQIASIDRDLAILKALATDWTCGPTLAKKHGISPEGIKAVYKGCLHRLHSDPEYAMLVGKMMPLSDIPGAELTPEARIKRKPAPEFGGRRVPPRRKITNTDSMGFMLGCRNSLLYTLLTSGQCTRMDLVRTVLEKFGGTESAAKATVSAFLSDIKHPFGKFNTSRNLKMIQDTRGRLSFERESLIASQEIIAIKRQQHMLQEATYGQPGTAA